MKISVIIPVYNVALYVEDCLRSIMCQTYTGDLECLLVDDSCTDDSITIIESMLLNYNGPIVFHLLHHNHNRGLSAARNTGLSEATGDYIYFLDSDDEISKDCIEKLATVVEQSPEVELVQGGRRTKNSRSKIKQPDVIRTENNEEVRKCYFLQGNLPILAWNKLVRRSFLLDHNLLFKEGILYEDLHWTFMLMKHLSNIVIIPDITYIYRIRPYSISTGAAEMMRAYSSNIVFWDILNNLTPGYEVTEIKKIKEAFYSQYARYSRILPDYKNTFHLFQQRARQHKCTSIRIMLVINHIASKTKYGWLPFAILRRLKC